MAAVQGDPGAYFAITPSPVGLSWHIRGEAFNNETVVVFIKFGDTTHQATYNATVDNLYRTRYSTGSPTCSVSLDPNRRAAVPIPNPPYNRGCGKDLELRLLGHKPNAINGGIATEWRKVELANPANVVAFTGELLRLSRKFKRAPTAGDAGHANFALTFDQDFTNILGVYSP